MTPDLGKPPRRPNRALWQALRGVLLALLLSLLVGFVIGLVLRSRMERPVRFLGESHGLKGGSALARLPLHLGQTRSPVFDAGHHEQEV
jgi:hypothetical protein